MPKARSTDEKGDGRRQSGPVKENGKERAVRWEEARGQQWEEGIQRGEAW